MAAIEPTTPTEQVPQPPAELPPTIMMALADVIDHLEDDDESPDDAFA